MTTTDNSTRFFEYENGTPTPPCRMCGRPRRRQNIGMGARESLSLYCGPKACDAVERICQSPGCGQRFSVGPGASKYCPRHVETSEREAGAMNSQDYATVAELLQEISRSLERSIEQRREVDEALRDMVARVERLSVQGSA